MLIYDELTHERDKAPRPVSPHPSRSFQSRPVRGPVARPHGRSPSPAQGKQAPWEALSLSCVSSSPESSILCCRHTLNQAPNCKPNASLPSLRA